jgi:hypothetical protein
MSSAGSKWPRLRQFCWRPAARNFRIKGAKILSEMKTKNAPVGYAGLQTTASDQMKSAQEQLLGLLQAPLTEEGFDRLLSILEQRQRAGLIEDLVLESPSRLPRDTSGAESPVREVD